MAPKPKQTARRAKAKAKSIARGTPSRDDVNLVCQGAPPEGHGSNPAPGCCPQAARDSIHERRARFGHAIQAVAAPGDDEAFMYTVGAEPEFLVEGVPVQHVEKVGQAMNFLVDRVNSGHPVRHGHTISSHGLLFRAVQLHGEALREALARKCTSCPRDAQIMLLEPIFQACARGADDIAGGDADALGGAPSHATIDDMLMAARRLTDPSVPGRTIWDECPQIVLCDDCRKRAVLLSPPSAFPLRVAGASIGCGRPVLWKQSADGFTEGNVVIICCRASLLFATGQPIPNIKDGTVKIPRSWYDSDTPEREETETPICRHRLRGKQTPPPA